MLAFDRMDPSSTVGGASKEAGPSSSVTGLVGVAAEEPITGVAGLEPGEEGGKV